MTLCCVHASPARPFDAGEVRLDESVEQSRRLKSRLSLYDESAELSLEDAEKLLADSETERKAIHGAL